MSVKTLNVNGYFGISVTPSNKLIGSGSSLIPVQDPTITMPVGSTVTLTFASGITSPTVTPPANVTWSSPTLTLSSSFTGGEVTISWGTDSSTSFMIAVGSGSAASARLTVNTDGSFFVTSLGSGVSSGVSLTDGVTPLVTGIPQDCQLQVSSPVFFLLNSGTGSNSTFTVTDATPATTASGLTASGNTVTVSNWSALDNSLVTAGNASFTVAQSLRQGTATAATSLTVSGGAILVTALGSGAYCTGQDLQYQTLDPGAYGFTFTASGLSFDGGKNIVFSGGERPACVLGRSEGTGQDSVMIRNTADKQNGAVFTIATGDGTLDPTILNNPDT